MSQNINAYNSIFQHPLKAIDIKYCLHLNIVLVHYLL